MQKNMKHFYKFTKFYKDLTQVPSLIVICVAHIPWRYCPRNRPENSDSLPDWGAYP